MKRILLTLMLSASPVMAADRTPWKEPAIGPISPTGTVVNIENYRCEVTGPRSMKCLNVGRVCVEKRARDEARAAKRFGCAIKGEPTYPCPLDDPAESTEGKEIGTCWPLSIGGF